ncbi:MAG TPA: hypothetical protein VE732_03965, partial [Nitrososphaera sp.]|nr:hypothetical protein [Nitrososphaera sp.]
VETLWRIFSNKNTYKRLMSKFLNGFGVVVDYRNPKRPKAFLPRDQRWTDLRVYRATVENLKSMDAEEFNDHLAEIGYDLIHSPEYANHLIARPSR